MKNIHATIAALIKHVSQLQPVIITDDDDREQEGDLILPAQGVTSELINFIMRECRGMICVAMEMGKAKKLDLQFPIKRGTSLLDTTFMRSIDSSEAITGFTAHEIAKTINTIGDKNARVNDFVTPGHVTPVVAREGGVLVRTGHTEAAVDVMQLADLEPAAVICEIMAPDGTMAKNVELKHFAERHNIPIFTIADIVSWRLRHDRIVRAIASGEIVNRFGRFEASIFRNTINPIVDHVALVTPGQAANNQPLVCVHVVDIISDICQDTQLHREQIVAKAFAKIAQHPGSIMVLINTPVVDIPRHKYVIGKTVDKPQNKKINSAREVWLREYGIGAQILLELGVNKMRLLSNTNLSLVALSGFGMEIVEQVRLDSEAVSVL